MNPQPQTSGKVGSSSIGYTPRGEHHLPATDLTGKAPYLVYPSDRHTVTWLSPEQVDTKREHYAGLGQQIRPMTGLGNNTPAPLPERPRRTKRRKQIKNELTLW